MREEVRKGCSECSEAEKLERPFTKTQMGYALMRGIVAGVLVFVAALVLAATTGESEDLATSTFGSIVVGVFVFIWYASPFLRRNVIGHYLYIYVSEGELHRHLLRRPQLMDIRLATGFDAFFRVRIGGWFKRCEIFASSESDAQHWTLESWTGDDLSIRDQEENVLRFGARALLQIVRRFGSAKELYVTLLKAEDDRDELGVGAAGLVDEIAATRTTLGRSRHAQWLREQLQALLAKVKPSQALLDRWQATARERREAAARAETAAL